MSNNIINMEERPWGRYFILDENEKYKIKRIEVEIGQRLSYQFHKYRHETWIIIQGQSVVTIEGKDILCLEGDTIQIKTGSKHRIKNTGKNKLVFIEVQRGTYFGEDDIVRIEDDYKRQ